METTNFGTKNRRVMSKGEFPKMELKLFNWFERQRKRHTPIRGPILKAKAIELVHKSCYGGSFNASNGWLTRFKRRFGLRLKKESGENLSSNAELVEPFINEFKSLITQNALSKDAIFNADETALFWKMLPDKTYVHSGEKTTPGRKISKERVTVLLCANASGTMKVKPLMIGKSQNPRAFRNKVLPVDYTNSKNAWMTSYIFKNWFFNMFVPQVESFLEKNNLPQRAILILDNAPCHPSANELVKKTADGKMWTIFLPPNVTPLIQPMDQNAIRLLKLHYKNSLLSKILSSGQQDNVISCLKSLTLYDAASLVASSFKAIKRESIANCWNKIFIQSEFDEEDDMPLSTLFQHDEHVLSLRKGVQLLHHIFPSDGLTADDLNEWVNDDSARESNFEEESENEGEVDENDVAAESDNRVKHADVIKYLEECIKWGQQNAIEVSQSLVLRELQEVAIQKSLNNPRKQLSIKHYFK